MKFSVKLLSAKAIDEGNNSAHELKLEYYEKNIEKFI